MTIDIRVTTSNNHMIINYSKPMISTR